MKSKTEIKQELIKEFGENLTLMLFKCLKLWV